MIKQGLTQLNLFGNRAGNSSRDLRRDPIRMKDFAGQTRTFDVPECVGRAPTVGVG